MAHVIEQAVANDERSWLGPVVARAMSDVPFYRDHLAGADASSLLSLPSFHKLTTAGYGRFPLSRGGPVGAHRVVATSGTTGDRMCVAFDRADWDRVGGWLEQVAALVELTSSDTLLNTHCYGLWVGGPVLDLLANRAGAGLIPLGPIAPATTLEFLTGGFGTAISATPSYLRRLVEAALEGPCELAASSLRLGFIGAEPAEPSLRRKLKAHLPSGFRWVELYGLTETGGPSVAFGPDPEIPELILNTRDWVAEVLDVETDAPVELGTVGELTLTTRSSDCRSPLIRYRTRDLVQVTAGEPTAPTRISRILGRADDALKVDGVLVYPTAVSEIMAELLPARSEWRALLRRQDTDDELVIEAEAGPSLCQAVELAFRHRVGLTVSVAPASVGSLERSLEKTTRIFAESTS